MTPYRRSESALVTEAPFSSQVGGLAEPDVAKTWGRLSQLLHARNPWRAAPDFVAENSFVRQLIDQLRTTLNSHLIALVGGRQELFCQVWAQPVRVYLFTLVDEGGPARPTSTSTSHSALFDDEDASLRGE